MRRLERLWGWVAGMPAGRFLLLVFVLNLLFRAAMVLCAKPYSPSHDGCHYLILARSLAEGEGYMDHVLYAPRFNQVRPEGVRDTFPFPDFQRPPLYPFLVSLMYRVLGESYLAALMVNVLLGSLLPLLSYALAMRLFHDRRAGVLAALLMTFNGALAAYTIETMLEFAFAAFVSLFLLVLLTGTEKRNPWLVLASGFLWGLAWYARHEALYVLFVPVVAEVVARFGVKRGVPLAAGVLLIAAACLIPWHWRAYAVTGNPFHNELKYHLFAAYSDYHEFFTLLTPLPDWSIGQFMLLDPAARLLRYGMLFFELLTQIPGALLGGVVLLLAVGVAVRKRGWKTAAIPVLWPLASVGFFALTFSEERFLYALLPLLLAYAAGGFVLWLEKLPPAPARVSACVKFAALALLLLALSRAAYSTSVLKRTGDLGHWPVGLALLAAAGVMLWLWRTGAFTGMSRRFLSGFLSVTVAALFLLGYGEGFREGRKERYDPALVAYLQKNTAPDDVVMMYRKPYFWGWCLKRNVMQLPLQDIDTQSEAAFYGQMAELMNTFRTRWIVVKVVRKKDGRLVNTHGWLPEETPMTHVTHVTRLERPKGKGLSADLFDIYRIDGAVMPRPELSTEIRKKERSGSEPAAARGGEAGE